MKIKHIARYVKIPWVHVSTKNAKKFLHENFYHVYTAGWICFKMKRTIEWMRRWSVHCTKTHTTAAVGISWTRFWWASSERDWQRSDDSFSHQHSKGWWQGGQGGDWRGNRGGRDSWSSSERNQQRGSSYFSGGDGQLIPTAADIVWVFVQCMFRSSSHPFDLTISFLFILKQIN